MLTPAHYFYFTSQLGSFGSGYLNLKLLTKEIIFNMIRTNDMLIKKIISTRFIY